MSHGLDKETLNCIQSQKIWQQNLKKDGKIQWKGTTMEKTHHGKEPSWKRTNMEKNHHEKGMSVPFRNTTGIVRKWTCCELESTI